jgi:GNAT superfamily N-acetyltransferase
MNLKITLAKTDEEILETYKVMKYLRDQYTEEEYLSFVKDHLLNENFQLALMNDNDQPVCVSGFRIGHSLAWGKFIYIDDLVTNPNIRSNGYGEALFNWVSEYGKEHGCKELHLDSGVQRHSAHRFYLRERMDIVFYHFKKILIG